jgi:hypothetical protein
MQIDNALPDFVRNENEITWTTGVGFLFVFKACPVLDTGA